MELEDNEWSFIQPEVIIKVEEGEVEKLEDLENTSASGTSSNDDSTESSDSDSQVNDDQKDAKKKKRKKLLRRGETFKSFEALEARRKEVEKVSHCFFYRRSSHGIDSKKAKRLKKKFHPRLKYYTIKYACDSGGKNFKTQSTGKRRSGTAQKGCKASFVVTATKNGKALEVREVNLKHNHECSEDVHNHKPRSRRLSKDDELEISHLLNFSSDKKEIKEYYQKKTGKVILMKDIINLAAKLNKGTKNKSDKAIEELKQT